MNQYKGMHGYTHLQDTPSDTWVIQHDLGTDYPIIDCFVLVDSVLTSSLPNSVIKTSNKIATVSWSGPFAGKAIVA